MNPGLQRLLNLVFMWLALYIILRLLAGCTTFGPAEWRPEQHVYFMRACSLSCRPGQMVGYAAVDGECKCKVRK